MVLIYRRQIPLGFFKKVFFIVRMVSKIRNVILVMSLSGTVIFLLWFVTYWIYFLEFKAKWLRNLILMAIPFFLIPLPICRNLFFKLFRNTGIMPSALAKNIEGNIDTTHMIIRSKNTIIFSIFEKTLLIYIVCMACISFLCILFQLRHYLKLKRIIKNQTSLPLSKKEILLFNETKQRIGIKQEIKFIKSSNTSIPFTTGIIHPVVVIPKTLPKYKDSLQMVLGHEFVHIKHKDVFFNLITCIILALHWFNIFSYILLCILKIANEMYCQLLIELSRKKNLLSDLFTLNFSGNKTKQIKRRIDNIMKCKKRKFAMAVIIGNIMLCFGIGLSFVYADANEMQVENNEDFSFDSEEDFLLETVTPSNTFYEDFFIDGNKNLYPCKEVRTDIICTHLFIFGTREAHTKQNNSCKIEHYHAERCTLCGKVVNYNLYYTESWSICPH